MSQGREKSHQSLRKKRATTDTSSHLLPGSLYRFRSLTGDTEFAQTLANFSPPRVAPEAQASPTEPASNKQRLQRSASQRTFQPTETPVRQSRIQAVLNFKAPLTYEANVESIAPSADEPVAAPEGMESRLKGRQGL